MDEYGYDDSDKQKFKGFVMGMNPSVQAALIFALPFIVIDFFNYYSAGTALALSTPLLALLYAGCGALAGKLASAKGEFAPNYLATGAVAGVLLWLSSTVVNTVIALIIGAASIGTTLLLGIPYLCICAPVQLLGGAFMGGLGGFIYSLIDKGPKSENDYYG